MSNRQAKAMRRAARQAHAAWVREHAEVRRSWWAVPALHVVHLLARLRLIGPGAMYSVARRASRLEIVR